MLHVGKTSQLSSGVCGALGLAVSETPAVTGASVGRHCRVQVKWERGLKEERQDSVTGPELGLMCGRG